MVVGVVLSKGNKIANLGFKMPYSTIQKTPKKGDFAAMWAQKDKIRTSNSPLDQFIISLYELIRMVKTACLKI